MPYRKALPSLEEMSLLVFTNNFHTMQDKLVHQPPLIINNIFEKLQCRQCESKSLPSEIFIRPENVSLHCLDNLPIEHLLDQFGRVCTNLVSLDLTGKCEIQFIHIVEVLKHLPRLQRLNLGRSSNCNVRKIVKNSPQLTHLDLSQCHYVRGLRSLSDCTKLVQLNICGTRSTVKKSFFLLQNLPVLKVFKNYNWDQIFCVLKQQFELNRTGRICSDSIEDASMSVESSEDIDIAVASFPRLRSLTFSWQNFNITLEHEIMQRLTRLHLYCVLGLDISLIGRFCPMLECLKLEYCSILISNAADSGEYIKNLRLLHIEGNHHFMTELQMLLLKCPKVEKLRIVGLDAFNDNVVAEFVSSNALRNLKMLILRDCKVITSKGIMDLMKMNNPLSVLECVNCANVDHSVKYVIDNYARQNNLDIEINII